MEKSLSELTGINLAMQTPMDADSSIDYARWEELIDLYIDAWAQGCIWGGANNMPRQSVQDEGLVRVIGTGILGLGAVNGYGGVYAGIVRYQ